MFDLWNVIPSGILSILYIVGGIVGVVYLLAPLAVYATFKFHVPTDVLILEPKEMQLPKEVRGFMMEQFDQLASVGFRPAGCFALPKLVANVKSINVLMVNEREGDSAMINVLWADSALQEVKLQYVEFVRRFARGGCLQTSNSSRISAFKSPADDQTFQFWDVKDASKLYGLHCKIAQSLNSGPGVISLLREFQGDVEAFIQKKVVEEPALYQEKVGLFKKVQGGFGLTLRGAYFFSWCELFPFNQLKRWRIRQNSKRWL